MNTGVSAAINERWRVVHSSFGRLRVHLLDPDGHVAAQFRQVPGVTHAKAGALTGNLLILFDPRQTSAAALLGQLPSVSVTTPQAVSAPEQNPLHTAIGNFLAQGVRWIRAGTRRTATTTLDPALTTAAADVLPLVIAPHHDAADATDREQELPSVEPAAYVTGVRGQVYKILGWSSVGMAIVGAILPGIPTVPFVVLASYFFIRTSPKAHAWLLRSRWFGPLLRDWEVHRGVRRSVKLTAVGLMLAGLLITVLLGLPGVVVASIVLLELIGLVVILRLPVIESPESNAPIVAASIS